MDRNMRREKDDAGQTRTAILNAAIQELSERGVSGATIERISRRAGLTRGAFYWHFKDKCDLIRALIESSSFPQRDLIVAAAEAGHADPFGLLTLAASEVLILFEADERRQQLFRIMSACDPGSDIAEMFRKPDVDMYHVLARLATYAQEQGDLADDFTPAEAAGVMMISMNGLLSEWLRSNRGFGLTDFGAKIIRNTLQLLQKQPEARKC